MNFTWFDVTCSADPYGFVWNGLLWFCLGDNYLLDWSLQFGRHWGSVEDQSSSAKDGCLMFWGEGWTSGRVFKHIFAQSSINYFQPQKWLNHQSLPTLVSPRASPWSSTLLFQRSSCKCYRVWSAIGESSQKHTSLGWRSGFWGGGDVTWWHWR